jgi:hypothetical protein
LDQKRWMVTLGHSLSLTHCYCNSLLICPLIILNLFCARSEEVPYFFFPPSPDDQSVQLQRARYSCAWSLMFVCCRSGGNTRKRNCTWTVGRKTGEENKRAAIFISHRDRSCSPNVLCVIGLLWLAHSDRVQMSQDWFFLFFLFIRRVGCKEEVRSAFVLFAMDVSSSSSSTKK